MSRMSTGTGSRPPTRMMHRSWSARSSLTWMFGVTVPISSRKSVPPLDSSIRPRLFAIAPVKAPFTCPNSSDSSSVSGMAEQLTATKERSARPLRWWIERATSSLPVPVSPAISTVARLGATRAIRSRTRSIAGLRPTISTPGPASFTCRRRRATSRRSSVSSCARRSVRSSSSVRNGLLT